MSAATPRAYKLRHGIRWPEKPLMLVTDRKQCGSRSLAEVVDRAIEGGVTLVQLREKDLTGGDLLVLARQLRGVCGQRALLMINDRPDVALLCGADGVHLGERGLPAAAVRQLLPATMLVGQSVHSVSSARQADLDGVDYISVGTIFPSPSHPEIEPAGLGLLSNIASRLPIPVLAIGGITPVNAASCRQAGAAGVAVISTIIRAEDPALAAAALLEPTEDGECVSS